MAVNAWLKVSPIAPACFFPSGGPVYTNLDQAGALHTDEFGCVWDRTSGMPHPIGYPLEEDYTLLDKYEIPDPYHAGRFDQAQEVADKFKDGQPVIMNLEGTEREVARRLIG